MDIKERIVELKKRRDAVIIAHHYAPVEVHEIADVLSDSRGFFESMKDGFDADVIVVIAPTFFADPSLEVEMGVHHGSVPVGMPFEVTRAEANRIYELDGKPAWHMLMDRLGQPHDTHPGPMLPLTGLGQELSPDLHEEYNNKLILRCVVKTEPDGSFYFPVDAQAGARFWLTERDEDLIFDGLEIMVGQLKERLNGRIPVAVFHTDCGARGRFLFNRILKDEIVSRMQSPLCGDQDVPWLGMYGWRVCPTRRAQPFPQLHDLSLLSRQEAVEERGRRLAGT